MIGRFFSIAVATMCLEHAKAAVEPLSVQGSQILVGTEHKGMAGNSFFWSNTGWGAERFYNANVVAWLKSDWGAPIVRAAMGVDENGGYLSDPSGNKGRVQAVVDAAIANDMYVIIDWHSHHAENYQSQAISFFTEMAQLYASYPNVIYEIYNEPLQISWSGTIKPYAEAVISAIRSIDPSNLIVVGTPTWSQDVKAAANDPITSHSNIAYALHFYAGTHSGWLRQNAQDAMSSGIALLVSEWGSVNADGNGGANVASTNEWVAWMKQNNLIHLNWSVHDKNEGASIVKSGVSSNGAWSDSDLTASGVFARSIIRDYNNGGGDDGGDNTDPCASATAVVIPARIQAEEYCKHDSVQKEQTSDNGGGQNIGYIENNDWTEYKVDVSTAGAYVVKIRVASDTNGGTINLLLDGNSIGSVYVPNTGGWQTWRTMTLNVNLQSTGEQILRLNFSGSNSGGLMNVNWIRFKASTTGPTLTPSPTNPPTPSPTSQPIATITNPPTPSPTLQPVATVTNPPTKQPTDGNSGSDVVCSFKIQTQWQDGFVGEIHIKNNGNSPVEPGWAVSFGFTDGSTIVATWNGNFSGNTNLISATPVSWNAKIWPGGLTVFGMKVDKGTAYTPAPTPEVFGSICG